MQLVRWKVAVCTACLVALPAGVGRGADDKPAKVEAKALDALVYKALELPIDRGADVYNGTNAQRVVIGERDPMGCYRIYEGALLTVRPMLDHHPNLQKAIDDALRTARADPDVARKAFDLRAVLDRVRKETNPNPAAEKTPVTRTLWDRLGGEKGVTKIVDDVVFAASDDPAVNLTRDGKVKITPEIKRHVVEEVSALTGGPLTYKGPNIKASLRGLHVTDTQFKAFVKDVGDVLRDDGVAPDDARTILRYLDSHKDIVEAPKPTAKSLWDRLGGEKGVTKVVDDLVAKAADDPKVDFTRNGKIKLKADDIAKMKKGFVHLISSWTGGPYKYEGKDMREVHKNMHITNAQFDAFASDFRAALEKNGATEKEVKDVMAKVDDTRKAIVQANKPKDEGKKPEKKPEKKDETKQEK